MEPEQNRSPQTPLSRRDFLRRAGTEAARTGTKLVPGAALAQKALGLDNGADTTLDGQPAKRSLLRRLADWRGGRGKVEGD